MEADGTFKVIIFLYSLSIECILKAKIFFIYEEAKSYLHKKNEHITKVTLKNWIYKNIYTHQADYLAKICGRFAKSDDKMLSIISHFIETGKYPVIKYSDIYSISIIRKKPVEDFWTKRNLKRFESFLIKIAKKCFGKKMEGAFSEKSLQSFHITDFKKRNFSKRNSDIIRMIKLSKLKK